MSKKVLIVESDSATLGKVKSALEGRHFAVQDTADGKGCIELIRRERPEVVVLAVDLPQGQNGYILCGKLKKDDELKSTPIVIIGNPDGFAQHKKLKTHADDYVAKPVDATALTESVGRIIGFPEPPNGEVVEDESLSLSDLVDEEDEPKTSESPAEEISVENETVQGDPDLDMLDQAFDSISEPGAGPPAPPEESASEEEEVHVQPESGEEIVPLETVEDGGGDSSDEALSALGMDSGPSTTDEESALDGVIEDEDDAGDKTQVSEPLKVITPPPPPQRAERGDTSALSGRLNEVQNKLADAERRADDAERKAGELEVELTSLKAELEAAKATQSGGKSDKEFFALREAGNKKDKEILRLKSELNEKEKELVELKDREMQLEQQVSETTGEMARKEAQIKTLSARADQVAADRKKFDQQLSQAREEARSAQTKLATLQAETAQQRTDYEEAKAELENQRSRADDLDAELQKVRGDADRAREEADELRSGAEEARREAESARSNLEQAQIDLDAAKTQLTNQATSFAEEAASLRGRIRELEEATQKHEERVTKFYAKIKDDEKVREKTKKALSIALQLLEEQQRVDMDLDEPAEA